MQENLILIRSNMNRNQFQDNSPKSEAQSTGTNQQPGGSNNQKSCSAVQSADEAIDVLSYMGFKL